MNRRKFLKLTGARAGVLAVGAGALRGMVPGARSDLHSGHRLRARPSFRAAPDATFGPGVGRAIVRAPVGMEGPWGPGREGDPETTLDREAEMTETEGGGEEGRGVVKAAGAVPMEEVSAGRQTRMHVLVGPDDGAPNYALRRFRMEEGGGIPFHTNRVEHEQYVLRGRARIRVGDEVHEVGPDDSLYIPAGTPHSYDVVEGPFEFICVVPNEPDEIEMREE